MRVQPVVPGALVVERVAERRVDDQEEAGLADPPQPAPAEGRAAGQEGPPADLPHH